MPSASSPLSRAVGKLVTGKVDGLELNSDRARAIADGVMSGVTLFKDNAGSVEQLFELVQQLRELGENGEAVLIAVDQEGGAVQRFDDVLTPLPSAMALAAMNDVQSVHEVAALCAQQLAALGVNCNLTPVLDVNSNPRNPIIGTRAFSDNPLYVAQLGGVVARAHLQHGVLPVGKHFPGHGDTFEDSHLALAVAGAEKATLEVRELKPFAELASQLPAMLIGHVHLPAFEQEPVPASLSRIITDGLLRKQMGFDGFLMTDDMPVMKAIVDRYGLEEAAIMAVAAGADNLLISGTVEQVKAVHSALMKAVSQATISEARLQQAIARREKAMAVTRRAPAPSLDRLRELIARDAETALTASARAIAVVRGALPRLSAAIRPVALLVPDHPRYRLELLNALVPYMKGVDISLHERRFPLNPSPGEIADALTFVEGKQTILLTFRALLNKGQLALAGQLTAAGRDGLVVATDVPYEVDSMPQWVNAAATFDPSRLAMQALAAVLAGEAAALGKPPVQIG